MTDTLKRWLLLNASSRIEQR